mmetsp:Transcript_85404/g.265523  ORF Transcript_85404/g.265523 Transcript_85404/m.265523 type:complete len:628 (-) Transcript_85404:50-1933(-)
MEHMKANPIAVLQQGRTTVAAVPPQILEEFKVLRHVDHGEVDASLQGRVESVHVREAVAPDPAVDLVVAARLPFQGRVLHRVAIRHHPHVNVKDVPRGQGDHVGLLLLHGIQHRGDVGGRVHVVVVEVHDVVAGGDMLAYVSLRPNADVLPPRHLETQVNQPGVLPVEVAEHLRGLPLICLYHDELLVRPRLRREALPQLPVELAPRLGGRRDHRRLAAARELAEGQRRGDLLLPLGLLLALQNRPALPLRMPVLARVQPAVAPEPEVALAFVPVDPLPRQRKDGPAEVRLGFLLRLAQLESLLLLLLLHAEPLGLLRLDQPQHARLLLCCPRPHLAVAVGMACTSSAVEEGRDIVTAPRHGHVALAAAPLADAPRLAAGVDALELAGLVPALHGQRRGLQPAAASPASEADRHEEVRAAREALQRRRGAGPRLEAADLRPLGRRQRPGGGSPRSGHDDLQHGLLPEGLRRSGLLRRVTGAVVPLEFQGRLVGVLHPEGEPLRGPRSGACGRGVRGRLAVAAAGLEQRALGRVLLDDPAAVLPLLLLRHVAARLLLLQPDPHDVIDRERHTMDRLSLRYVANGLAFQVGLGTYRAGSAHDLVLRDAGTRYLAGRRPGHRILQRPASG